MRGGPWSPGFRQVAIALGEYRNTLPLSWAMTTITLSSMIHSHFVQRLRVIHIRRQVAQKSAKVSIGFLTMPLPHVCSGENRSTASDVAVQTAHMGIGGLFLMSVRRHGSDEFN